MSGLIELASQVKGVVSAQRIKRENAAFLMVSKLAVAFCLVAILLLALNSYFGERIHCFDTTKGGVFIESHKLLEGASIDGSKES